jgi:hypothetical protein
VEYEFGDQIENLGRLQREIGHLTDPAESIWILPNSGDEQGRTTVDLDLGLHVEISTLIRHVML